MADKRLNIKVDVKDLTSTELILEVQRLHFRDPELSVKAAAALRKIADGIENKEVGLTRLDTRSVASARDKPVASFSFDFIDFEHEKKSSKEMSNG